MQIATITNHAHTNALTTNPSRRTAARSQQALDEETCESCRAELLKHEQGLFSLDVKGRPGLTQLKQMLLKRGGELFQRNDILAAELTPLLVARLIHKGRFFPPEAASFLPMLPHHCHENVLVLAINGKAAWWTGLALSDDGFWRPHSWGFDGAAVIETTDKKELYYGVRVPIKYYADLAARRHRELIEEATEIAANSLQENIR